MRTAAALVAAGSLLLTTPASASPSTPASEARGTAVAAGMYLSADIYVEIITDAKGYTATQIEISLSRTLSLLSQFGTNSGTNVNIRYSRDY